MLTDTALPGSFLLPINAREKTELLRLLEQALRETWVEMHRTHAANYRAQLVEEQAVFNTLLGKIYGLHT